MKTVTIQDIVQRFNLEVLVGHNELGRELKKTKVRRPGLEFMDKFDFIATEHVQILGKNEINYLHKHLEELSTEPASEQHHVQLRQDLFVVGTIKTQKTQTQQERPVKDKINISKKMSFNKSVSREPATKRPALQTQRNTTKEGREEAVLGVIKDKGVVSIKDISSVIFDCSEKTIQRVLQALIDKGQIKKEGERRWAKYQLS